MGEAFGQAGTLLGLMADAVIDLGQCGCVNRAYGAAMMSPDMFRERARRCLEHAKQLRADAEAAHKRSAERRRMAERAKEIAERLLRRGSQALAERSSAL
jgi:hypothetical protein